MLLSFASPAETSKFGLRSEVIIGELTDKSKGLDPDYFLPNNFFIAFLHRIIGLNVPNCPWLRYQALRIKNGKIPIIDQKQFLKDTQLLAENIIGECIVQNGLLVGYNWSESYRLVTKSGLMQLDLWFQQILIEQVHLILRSENELKGNE